MISLIAGGFFFIVCLAGVYIATQNFTNSQLAEVGKLLQNYQSTDLASINAKLDSIAKYIAGNSWSNFDLISTIFIILAGVFAVVFAVWIANPIQYYEEPSYVLLTKQSIKARDESIKRLRKEWLRFLISLFLDIIVGLISSYLFVKIFG